MEAKLVMNTILTETKNMSDILYHGTLESSTPVVYKAFRTILNESLNMQQEIFDFMKQKGWYVVSSVEDEKVKIIKKKFHS